MRVVYLSKTDAAGPGSRYRIYQYLPYFSEKGVDVTVLPCFCSRYVELSNMKGFVPLLQRGLHAVKAFVRRLAHLVTALGADLVAVEREFFPCAPPIFELLIKLWKGGYLLEFDDAIFLSRGRRMKYPATVSIATKVIVGNGYLEEYARRYNSRVFVIPTTVDVSSYSVKSSYELSDKPRVGWVGLPYNFPHLRLVKDPVLRLVRDKEVEFVVISGRKPEIDVPLTFVPWSEETEKEEIGKLDVGIMPLLDTPFARGKCGLKILQYMAAGVPVVASPVGVNSSIIEDGVNGFLARTAGEWEEKLKTLIQDGSMRERMGREGRRTVEEKYSLEVWGEKLVSIYVNGGS